MNSSIQELAPKNSDIVIKQSCGSMLRLNKKGMQLKQIKRSPDISININNPPQLLPAAHLFKTSSKVKSRGMMTTFSFVKIAFKILSTVSLGSRIGSNLENLKIN